MDELNRLIGNLIKEKGGSHNDYLTLLNAIAFHETGGTMDPSIKQTGGGPGRGLFQFEEGLHSGAITAAKRTKQYLKSLGEAIPKWLEESSKGESLDASSLSPEQQQILFLGNMRMHPKADFSKVWNGKEDIPTFWANYHWAGPSADRAKRLKSFDTSYNKYKQENPTYPSFIENFTKEPRQNTFAEGGPVDPPTKKRDISKGLQQLKEYTGNQKGMYADESSQQYKDWVEKDRYYNPKKESGITSGDDRMDFLYKNDWLFDVPIVKNYLKDKAFLYASESNAYNRTPEDIEYIEEMNKRGESTDKYSGVNNSFKQQNGAQTKQVNLLRHYIYKDQNPKIAPYAPKSDYFNWLPTYTLKDEKRVTPEDFNDALKSIISSKFEYNDEANDGTFINDFDESYAKFLKDKKPIYKSSEKNFLLGTDMMTPSDLGAYKAGAAWDEDRGLPYISVSDAWDFEPSVYGKRWTGQYENEYETTRQRSKIQSHLLHKAGNPFKIYDRYYFNPDTKEYIPDSQLFPIQKAAGGYLDKSLNSFNNGGSHETNPHGGIPLGIGSNGKMNTVEQGETSFMSKQGKYIFSNRLTLAGKLKKLM